MEREQVVVAWIDGELEGPAGLSSLVQRYRELSEVAALPSYPKHVDDDMNALYDAMEVMA